MSEQKIYLIPTVIADNTEKQVITDQVKHIISQLDYFLVEEVRTARRHISKLKLGLVIENLRFEVLKRNTPPEVLERYFYQAKGKNIGILSESGCPGIADPGAAAVAFAHQKNIRVVPLSGPSSIFLALMASGFNGQSFVFHGYIPIDKKEREKNSLRDATTQIQIISSLLNSPSSLIIISSFSVRSCRRNYFPPWK